MYRLWPRDWPVGIGSTHVRPSFKQVCCFVISEVNISLKHTVGMEFLSVLILRPCPG